MQKMWCTYKNSWKELTDFCNHGKDYSGTENSPWTNPIQCKDCVYLDHSECRKS